MFTSFTDAFGLRAESLWPVERYRVSSPTDGENDTTDLIDARGQDIGLLSVFVHKVRGI